MDIINQKLDKIINLLENSSTKVPIKKVPLELPLTHVGTQQKNGDSNALLIFKPYIKKAGKSYLYYNGTEWEVLSTEELKLRLKKALIDAYLRLNKEADSDSEIHSNIRHILRIRKENYFNSVFKLLMDKMKH